MEVIAIGAAPYLIALSYKFQLYKIFVMRPKIHTYICRKTSGNI